MVETEKLPEGQRAWPISPFKRYSRVRRRLCQQPCTSRMVVSLGLCLLACALASAAGEWQSVEGYRFKALTVSTNEPVGFTSLSPDSTDFNGDGRVDLLTAQNNDRVKLHLNLTGKPGLRVHLKGAGENVQAIGASIRLEQNGSLGPKREIRLGSGYWSQDGLVQLFVVGDSKAKLHIRWADSSIATVLFPAGAKGIVISQTDGVKVVH